METMAIQSHKENGRLTPEIKEKIITMLLSGEFPIDAEIARRCNVSISSVQNMIKTDPDLAEARRQSQLEMAQMVEKTHLDLAINGSNEVARQKALEFLSRKLMPEKYGDNSEKVANIQTSKRIVFNLTLPEVKVDSNGIPIVNSTSPLDDKVIDV